MAPYCDVQVVSVTVGWPGKVIVKRSSRLENSFQSCANDVPDMASTRAEDISGIRRMLILLIVTPSVPELDGRLQRVAVDALRIRDTHLKIAFARNRGRRTSGFAEVGK